MTDHIWCIRAGEQNQGGETGLNWFKLIRWGRQGGEGGRGRGGAGGRWKQNLGGGGERALYQDSSVGSSIRLTWTNLLQIMVL
jgi:hypothetical protein